MAFAEKKGILIHFVEEMSLQRAYKVGHFL